MIPIIIASRNGVSVKFMSQGIGPVNKTKDILKEFFDEIDNTTIVAVRDKYKSELYLKNFSSLKSVFVPDDLGYINSNLIDKEDYHSNNEYMLIVSNDRIENLKKHQGDFIEFCNSFKNKYGLDVVFLSFDLVWHGDEQTHYLGSIIEGSEHIEISPNEFIPIERIYSYINNAKFLITERYHASIVAMQTCTPYIIKLDTGIEEYAYNKAHGILCTFFEGIEYNEKHFIQNNWNNIFETLFNNYEYISKEQNTIFNSKIFINNLKNLRNIRHSYMEQIVLD